MSVSELRKLGANIRRERRRAGHSQEKLAELSSSHRNYIGGVERGERNPTATKLLAIARALGCGVSALFAGLESSSEVRLRSNKGSR